MAKQSRKKHATRTYEIILALVWLAVLAVCLMNRERFTVDGVLSYTPQNAMLAAIFMMALFALKSVSIFIFSGILFAANGILFPLPAAILLNILGAAIMISIPFWLGKKLGKGMIDRIADKYPKIELLRQLRTEHEFILSFLSRAVNILPSDILSLYMGAAGIDYRKYLPGSILGMLLSLITFPIMGRNLAAPGSPAFLLSAGVQASVSAVSVAGYWLYYRKKSRKEPRK